MPTVTGPVHVAASIPNSTNIHRAIVNIKNLINLQGIRIYNKGPFDVKYSGSGILGEDWIPAGISVAYHTENANNFLGQMSFIAYATTANSDSQFYDVANYSIILITEYQYGEDFDTSSYTIPVIAPSPDCNILDVPGCQGTTVTVPNSGGTFVPYTNKDLCYLLGFDLTTGVAAAEVAGNLVIQGLNGYNTNSSTLTYMLRSDIDNPTRLSIRYPRSGIVVGSNQNIQFVVPSLSTQTVDLCVFYTFNPGVFI